MSILKNDRLHTFRTVRVLWVSFLGSENPHFNVPVFEVPRHLSRRGHKVRGFSVGTNAERRASDQDSQPIWFLIPVRYARTVSIAIFTIILFLFLPLQIVLMRPDFIITEPGLAVFGLGPAVVISKLMNTILILDIRSIPVETYGFRGLLDTLCFDVSVLIAKKLFGGITIITSQMNEEVCRKYDLDPSFIGVWSSGVNTSVFDPEKYSRYGTEMRTKLGLADRFIVFYHGVFSQSRGLTETIEAISIVRDLYPDIALLLLGGGPIALHLKSMIREKGLQGNVVILDPVDYPDVPKFIAVCNVGIVPLPNISYWRFQCPLKLLEYLSMRKPVILTDIPAHRVVVEEEECGIYVRSAKPRDIVDAIVYCYQNRDKLEEWGTHGRRIVEERYSWAKSARDLEDYLLSLQMK